MVDQGAPENTENTNRSRSMPTEAEARVGDVLAGKYRLKELLGSGGMGDVYRAENLLVGRMVAIKVLQSHHAQSPEVVDRFLREARAANLVRHRNVVDMIDVGEDRGLPFIVQELLTGQDLSKKIAILGGKLSVADTLRTLFPVIEAVAEAHARGVVHRDIKPENVFLANVDGKVVPKLLDFGISKVRAPDLRTTEVGVMMGTPAYMAPEQLQGARTADPRTDVWALGVTLFEVMTGRLPFDGLDAPQMFVSIATQDPPKLIDVMPDAPPVISKIVDRCLRRKPDDRYATAAELARDLAHVMDGEEPEATQMRSIAPAGHAVPDLVAPAPARVPKMGRAFEEEATAATQIGTPLLAASEQEELPPPPSLRLPEPRVQRAPPPPASSSPPAVRLRTPPPAPVAAVSGAMPGVMMGPHGSSSPIPARRSGQMHRIGSPQHASSGPDMSAIVGIIVVALVVIAGVATLMAVAHRSEGWPIVTFLVKPAASVASAIQIGLALVVGAVGVTYARRGMKHWRGELAGGVPSALFGAVIAAAALFSAVELVSAAW